jgi:hypothetical protein
VNLRRALWLAWVYVAPLVLPWALLFAVDAWPPSVPLARRQIPREARLAQRCTWACHNRGCTHAPRLPAALTSDRYLFGATIDGLYTLGRALSSDRARGYGAANILVFCVAWPGLMYALWVAVWRQRAELAALRAKRARAGGSS